MKYLNILKEDMEAPKKREALERSKSASESEEADSDGDESQEHGPGTPLITKEMRALTAEPNMGYEKFSTDPFGKKEAARLEKKKKEYLALLAEEQMLKRARAESPSSSSNGESVDWSEVSDPGKERQVLM